MMLKNYLYEVEVTNTETIVFVNSIRVKNMRGFLWLWKNIFRIIRSVKRHPGAFECIPALVSPLQIVMVSYWYNDKELDDYHRDDFHRSFSRFVAKHPETLSMYFESYSATKSGKYISDAFGLAKNFPKKGSRGMG